MLQVAFGGYISESDTTVYNEPPNLYYEPGYNILFPLTLTLPTADSAYFLIRKRTNAENTTFATMSTGDLRVDVRDTSTGQVVGFSLGYNILHDDWNDNCTPLVLTVYPKYGTGLRVRSFEVVVTDITDSDFVAFRAMVTDEARPMNVLTIHNDGYNVRGAVSFPKTRALTRLSDAGSYMIISPSTGIVEVTDPADAQFSYPQDRFYYRRVSIYDNETYDFSITDPSHLALNSLLSISRIPGNGGVAVLSFDAYAVNVIKALEGKVTFKVRAESKSSLPQNVEILNVTILKTDKFYATD